MRRGIVITLAALVFLLALPLGIPAADREESGPAGDSGMSPRDSSVELTIRNEEQSDARVALAYLQGDVFVAEGWRGLAPEQIETITLRNVRESDIYIYVEFKNPKIRQFTASEWKVECPVSDADFLYTLEAAGGQRQAAAPGMRKVFFQNIHKLYRTEKGKLWFNLSAAAG